MCDSDKEDSFTISHALKALDEGEDQEGYKYFQERRWLDWTNKDINNRTFVKFNKSLQKMKHMLINYSEEQP